jgi:hypothetical protein
LFNELELTGSYGNACITACKREAGTATMIGPGGDYSQNQINLSKWEERPILFHCINSKPNNHANQ